MASIRSLPFNIEAKTEASGLLHGRNYRRRFSYFPAKSAETNAIYNSIYGNSKHVKFGFGKPVADFRIGQFVGAKRLQTMSADSMSGEKGGESDDSIDATIERSKKVLEVQRELLQQIVGSVESGTTIKSRVNETWEKEDSNKQEQIGSPIVRSENAVNLQNGGTGHLAVEDKAGNSIDYGGNRREQEKPIAIKKPISNLDLVDKLESMNLGYKLSDVTGVNIDDGLCRSEIEEVKPPPLAGANVMNVLLVVAECAPWSKTGGLGDVAGSLPKALARRGHRVMVVVPRYGNYSEPQHTGVRKHYMVAGQNVEVGFYHIYKDGVDFVFIDCHLFHHREQNIYGGDRVEVLKRMVIFCKAAVEVPWHVPCGGVCYGDGNLVFIANDWHTALLPVYLKACYRDNGLMRYARSILVIHNIAHQGRGPMDDFLVVDLSENHEDLFRLNDPVGGEHFNIFAAGLKTADRVVTVSHGYSGEIKTSQGGWGLHEIINKIDWKLKGIVNGIDLMEWNPERDIHLMSDGYENYSLETLESGKPLCKAALQKELGLPIRQDVPLIGFIGRLDQQKGVDLIAKAIPWMMSQNVQLVMLGAGRRDLEELLRRFENEYRDKVRGWVGFSVKTAHRITAGADILLMPSRFEPCGLNQLYAMKYGTIPVVHAVGGLKDTVRQFDPYAEMGLGWTFGSAETGQLTHALGNCLLTYREYKQSWEGLQRRGMEQDLSWDQAAVKYEEVMVAAKYQW